MTKDEKAELIGQIIDIFEDELEERTIYKTGGFHISGQHFTAKAEVPLYQEDEESEGVFYGNKFYDKVAVKIEETLQSWELLKEEEIEV